MKFLHSYFARKHICRVLEEFDQGYPSNVQQLRQDFHELAQKMVVRELIHLASALQPEIYE